MLYRVCYADTDAGGVVYHAVYLAIFERARSEFLRHHGVSVRDMQEEGTIFPVIRVEIDFMRPARLDDLLEVVTSVEALGRTSFTLLQKCLRHDDGTPLVSGLVTLAAVSPLMKPRRIPEPIRSILETSLENG